MIKAKICKRGHERTPENLRGPRACRVCYNEAKRGIKGPVVYSMCRNGLHDLNDPALVRVSAKGRECKPCAKDREVAKNMALYGQRSKPKPRRSPRRWTSGGRRFTVVAPGWCKGKAGIGIHDLGISLDPQCVPCATERARLKRRARGAPERSKTHCSRGHERTPENTKMMTKDRGKAKYAACRQCLRDRHRGREIWKRDRVLGRDLLCTYCGVCPSDTIDHVIPKERGGSNRLENLVGACFGCNASKGVWLVSEWPGRICPTCEMPTGALLDGAT